MFPSGGLRQTHRRLPQFFRSRGVEFTGRARCTRSRPARPSATLQPPPSSVRAQPRLQPRTRGHKFHSLRRSRACLFRNTVVFTTLANSDQQLPARAQVGETRSVCSVMPPETIWPLEGSSAIWPEVKTKIAGADRLCVGADGGGSFVGGDSRLAQIIRHTPDCRRVLRYSAQATLLRGVHP